MIKVVEDSNSKKAEVIDILSEQGYTYDYLVKVIFDKITNNSNKWFNIYCAESIGGEHAEIMEFCENFMHDYVCDKIIEAKEDYEYNFIELTLDVIDENESEIDDLDSSYKMWGDEQIRIWQDDEDQMRADYYGSIL